jgi:molecular chaperone DnaJ
MDGEFRREWLEKDYYQVLGVPKNASEAEIKAAYRRLAREYHPDRNRGNREAEERFKEVNAAYEVLSDPRKRQAYDRVREMAASGFGPGFGFGGPGRTGRVRVEGFPFDEGLFGDLGDLGDLFSVFTGRRPARAARGADLETEVRLSFEDAMRGATVPIRVEGPAPCPRCGGSGAEPGTTAQACPQCRGTGVVAENQGFFSFSRPCPRCGGSGAVVATPCGRCGGRGSVRATRELSVRIPPGVDDGARIRVAERGEPGPPGARPGDLYVVVRVAPHPVFGRRNSDLTVDLPITFPEAALGSELRVPTLDGAVTLRIPPGTRSGQTFRIRGKGAPRPRGGSGDLLVTVHIDVPRRLSKEERELLVRLRELQRESPRKGLGVEG